MRLAPPLSIGEAPPPDDLEILLRAYFRSEMPDPWPAPPVRASVPQLASLTSRRTKHRGRLALAASVALLIAGSLAIPSRSPTGEESAPAFRLLPGEATRVRVTETFVQPKDKPTEWRIQVTEDVPPGK